MYSLREVVNTNKAPQGDLGQLLSNSFLGKRYVFIHRDTNREEFDTLFKSCFDRECLVGEPCKENAVDITCKAFVTDESGQFYPLYSDNDYYIVMPNGQTFERLTV